MELVKIKTSAVAITVDDPELITSDKQRIGLQVTADVFRPHETDLVTSNYARYRGIYTDDIRSPTAHDSIYSSGDEGMRGR